MCCTGIEFGLAQELVSIVLCLAWTASVWLYTCKTWFPEPFKHTSTRAVSQPKVWELSSREPLMRLKRSLTRRKKGTSTFVTLPHQWLTTKLFPLLKDQCQRSHPDLWKWYPPPLLSSGSSLVKSPDTKGQLQKKTSVFTTLGAHDDILRQSDLTEVASSPNHKQLEIAGKSGLLCTRTTLAQL